jgi:tetratricopeptide (TPR) repeat protein
MKKLYWVLTLAVIFIINGCGLLDGDGTGGFDAILNAAPYKGLTDSIENDPKNVALLLKRADLLTQNNRSDIAYYDYKKSYELQPSEPTALLYSSSLFMTGRNKDVIALLQDCIKKYPQNTEFSRRLGEVYVQTGNTTEALAIYDNLLKTDSSNFDVYHEKGLLYASIKDTAKAIAMLQQSYHIQPTIRTGLALANFYAETNNANTIALCDALSQRDTARDFIEPLFLKGVYYSNVKEYAKAISLFDECTTRNWQFIEPYIEKGIIFYEQKNYDEALKTFQMAATIQYTYPDCYYWLGRCYEAIGKTEEAKDHYFKALTFDRNFTEAREALDRIRAKK